MLSEKEQQYLAKLIALAKKKVKEEHGIEIKADIKIDTARSLEENKASIIEAVKKDKEQKLKAKPSQKIEQKKQKKETVTKVCEEQKQKARQEEKEAQKIVEEFNKSIQCKNQDITKHYARLRKSVELTAKGYFKSTFLHGKAGLGKSYQVTAILNELGFKLNSEKGLPVKNTKDFYTVFSGDMSLAYLYRFLYENNGKLIIFRDLVKLINSLRTIDILKATTETHGRRVVQKGLYSKKQEDLPDSFVCESRFIFEMNSLKFRGDMRDDVEALLSRGDYVSTVFSFEEVSDIMKQIAKSKEEKEVTDFLIQNYDFVGWNNFNLRMQNKAFNIHHYAKDEGKDWKQELLDFLKTEMTETRRQLYPYIGRKAVRTSELKKLLVRTHIDNCYNLRTADRRIRDYILMNELFIVGFVSREEEELEAYLDNHRNYYLSINPIEALTLSDTSDTKTKQTTPRQEIDQAIQQVAV
ncbi:hypothetical protein JXA85_02255 [Candidatus Woesearchaeota archaeon]|nr:hypothetical protein [Candidatus Woesearchaeota archaeon]